MQIAVSSLQIGRSNKLGIFSEFVRNCEKNLKEKPNTKINIQAKIVKSSLVPPSDLNKNIVMIANGAGVAPMRGIIHRKMKSITKGENPKGLLALFFGTKTKGDLLFEGDLSVASKMRALNDFKVAYSRETVILVKF